MMYPPPLPVPEVEIAADFLATAGVRLIVRREDLNHPTVSGNKYWKLKYNLLKAQNLGYDKILTFGGAFSNHIAATAAACHVLGLGAVGVIRGEDADTGNPTLAKARENGMQLHLVSRAVYREKTSAHFLNELKKTLGRFYLIPEGGTNELAIAGTMEMMRQVTTPFDYLALPVGTGGTMAGCINELNRKSKVLGFAALKGDFLAGEIRDLQQKYHLRARANWEIVNEYHFGGYAKVTPVLADFIASFNQRYGIPLDPVYTGKMMFGIFDLIKTGHFPRASTILALHTGGLQGIAGFV